MLNPTMQKAGRNHRIDLRVGDCIQRMQKLESGSIDAMVSDPPYELGFMGKGWDGSGIAFSPALWDEVYRVLKPGGVVKAFSGTRTFHRMAQAIAKAGFINIGLEAWKYGCLPEDTEILTETGWKPGLSTAIGERVACWNPKTEQITLETVQDTFSRHYTGDLVTFKNLNTDQALTPNHRVYKKHRIRTMIRWERVASEEPEWNVEEAGLISRWNTIRLPLAGMHDGAGIEGGIEMAELLGWIWTEGGFDKQGYGVHITQSSVNQDYVDVINNLVTKLIPQHKHYIREREHTSRNPTRGTYQYTEHTWFFSGEFAKNIRRLLPDKHPTWGLIWSMTQQEKVAFMWASIRGDGSTSNRCKANPEIEEGSCFYQKHDLDLEMFQVLCHITNQCGIINKNKNCVGIKHSAHTQFQIRALKSSKPIPYDGLVWCVTVPTGAFIARRNGLVFITGNSGFPKSLNVGKALDKLAGAERTPKQVPFSGNAVMRHGGENNRPWMDKAAENGYHELPGDEPVSDHAKTWDGWGTALKPSWEPIVIGYKPS